MSGSQVPNRLQPPQQLQPGDILSLAGSAARQCIANGAPPPQVPQLMLASSPPPLQAQQQQQEAGVLLGDPAAEAHALAQEAAHLQAQAQNFKARSVKCRDDLLHTMA